MNLENDPKHFNLHSTALLELVAQASIYKLALQIDKKAQSSAKTHWIEWTHTVQFHSRTLNMDDGEVDQRIINSFVSNASF